MSEARIVVGVDGSPAGAAALRWAATDAWLRDAELEVVVSYHWQLSGVRFDTSRALQNAADDRARAIVNTAVAEARAIGRSLRIRGTAMLGDPVPVLLDAARDAALLVVGGRGSGGFRGLLLGSVSAQVATHAPCPVAVVRGRGNTALGPVVVGVDGSPAAHLAADLAFEEAALRGQEKLVAVRAYTAPPPPAPLGMPPIINDAEKAAAHLYRELTDELAGWREKHPDVDVDDEVADGSPAAVLVDRSHQAQLVVVRSRGRGGFDGLLLGSVGLHLLRHADCPVLIAHARS